MNYQTLLVVFFITILTGCSTYTTNTKTTFDSIQLNGQKPVIHVGEIHETPDKISLLGWVDADVTQPHWFADKPTEEQVNIILAEKGAALGADAVIYVTYSTHISSSTTVKLEGRGQAVKLKHASATLIPTIQENPQTNNTNAKVTATATTATVPVSKPHNTVQNIDGDNVPITLEEISAIKIHNNKLDKTPISLQDDVIKRELAAPLQQQTAAAPTSCVATINDMHDYQAKVDSINFMIMNAEFLVKKARGIKNGDMESAASRLLFMLEQQLDQIKKIKPATP